MNTIVWYIYIIINVERRWYYLPWYFPFHSFRKSYFMCCWVPRVIICNILYQACVMISTQRWTLSAFINTFILSNVPAPGPAYEILGTSPPPSSRRSSAHPPVAPGPLHALKSERFPSRLKFNMWLKRELCKWNVRSPPRESGYEIIVVSRMTGAYVWIFPSSLPRFVSRGLLKFQGHRPPHLLG